MPDNLPPNDSLLNDKDAAHAALEEYILHRRRLLIIEEFGTFDCDPAYDYKLERQARKA